MQSKHIYPAFELDGFECPLCHTHAHQTWTNLSKNGSYMHELKIATCSKCKKYSIWLDKKMIYPASMTITPPNPDMNEDVQKCYNEAIAVYPYSKRAAAALLRLAIEFLCKQLGATSDNLDKAIPELIKKGLDPEIIKPLDAVRVIGNHAIHPGQIDVEEDIDITKLFDLINYIAKVLITNKKELNDIISLFPEKDQKAIHNR